MIRRPPRSTPIKSSAASDVYKRQNQYITMRAYRGFFHFENSTNGGMNRFNSMQCPNRSFTTSKQSNIDENINSVKTKEQKDRFKLNPNLVDLPDDTSNHFEDHYIAQEGPFNSSTKHVTQQTHIEPPMIEQKRK
eukprot:TRINITY_DN2309_c0_g1_i1.p1 TRINITY_DN2309_c0_g1~~TRINITY_DN2309_c0_g1_i1.p1  ORF type:complete len:135 (+),score=25.46 TRINITY_DN2309_c0_g1_i1:1-405(+)